MSRFNTRIILLVCIIAATSGFSFLFVQRYIDDLSLTLLSVLLFLGLLLLNIFIGWKLSQKLLSVRPSKNNLEETSPPPPTPNTFLFDSVTNLPTAQHALAAFEHKITHNENQPLAAIVLKPINFEQANTLLGHHNSDLLLLQLAYCLQLKVADNTALLNFSGDEAPVRIARLQGLNFLVVLNLADSKHDNKVVINNLCTQLMASVPKAMSFKSYSLNFELAFGVAILQENGVTAHEVVAHAGDALLDITMASKAIGYFNNEKLRHTQQQLVSMEQLRNDILDGKLHWYLQPQVNVNDSTILGFQLRGHWYESESTKPRELEDFASLAEHSGEMHSLAKVMIKQAFLALKALQKENQQQQLSISLPSNCLFQPDLVEFIGQQIEHFHISGRYLLVELNESVLLKNVEHARQVINQLKSLDISIAITNFSGSYEVLRYVRKMAIHQIKISCQQLTHHENRVDKAITHALITLTRTMKLPLIGTDIDKSEAADVFVNMGGKYIQGNIISRGFVLDELHVWLKKWHEHHNQAL